VSGTYSDVDASAEPKGAVSWQDRVDQWPQIQAYKRRIRELLAEADSVVDVGCGPGGDVLAMGTDRCVGVDRSVVMCTAAAARGAPVCRADVHALPFPGGRFGGSIADRVVQHVEEPARALREMIRVLRPGGRLVVADPDQETLVIHVPRVRQELADRVKVLRRDIGYRNGRLVSSLPVLLTTMGVTEISIEPFPLSLSDPNDAFGLPGWPRLWQAEGGFSDDDVNEWERAITSGESGFLYSLIYFVVSGVISM
jgi:SAM-dependent methyltransferase